MSLLFLRIRGRAFWIALAAIGALAALPARGGPGEVGSGDRLAFALTGARVILSPGRVVDPGVVVIRGGLIEAAGPAGQISIPADARILDQKGRIVHAAFLDPYVTADRLAGKKPRAPQDEEEPPEPAGPRTESPGATSPDSNRATERVLPTLAVKDRVAEAYWRLGFAVVAAVPSSGILRGGGAVASLAPGPLEDRVLASDFGQYVSLEPERFDFAQLARAVYPSSRMGAAALVRQSFLDALWWRDAGVAYSKSPAGQARPAWNAAAAALVGAAEGRQPVVFEAADVLSLLRAGKITREFGLKALYVGAGDEYRLRG
ncbi:MAG: hypothetical protein ACRD3M_10360, partial [Thermoanaerobaculia bacterium]